MPEPCPRRRFFKQVLNLKRHFALLFQTQGFVVGNGYRFFIFKIVGQQIAGAVNDRHVFDVKLRNRRGNQLLNGMDAFQAQFAAVGLDDNRSGGHLLFAGKHFALGQHQMHPRRLDVVHRTNRSGQFALKRTDQIDVLHKVGRTQRVGIVKNLITDVGTFGRHGQIRGINAHFVDVFFRHQNLRAVFGQPVFDVGCFQMLDNLFGVFHFQIGIQHGVVTGVQLGSQINEKAYQKDDNRSD